MDQTHYIYAITCPEDGLIKYIGRSINPETRLRFHPYDGTEKKLIWLNQIKAKGLQPGLVILQVCGSLTEAKEVELYWIMSFLERGYTLFNRIYPGYDRREMMREIKMGYERRRQQQ